jgi:hypothetical protein
MREPIDELAKRKPTIDLAHSAPIVLADGQTWHLPKPWLVLQPIFSEGKPISVFPFLAYGDEIDDLIVTIGEASDNAEIIIGVATLASWMLAINYDLTDDDLNGLLWVRRDDLASWDWAKTVMDVATGRDRPKVSSDG